jgi:hypothetical protein
VSCRIFFGQGAIAAHEMGWDIFVHATGLSDCFYKELILARSESTRVEYPLARMAWQFGDRQESLTIA